MTFWAKRFFFLSYIWHFYDDNCDKTRYHHRCGGLLLLWQKNHDRKIGFSSWAGRRRSYMTFFGTSMTEKTVVEARARKFLGSSRLWWVVGGLAMHISLVHIRACVWGVGSNWTRARHWALTEPERLHYRLRITEPEWDRWLLTEPDRAIP